MGAVRKTIPQDEEIRVMTPLGILRMADHRLTRLASRAKWEAERADSPKQSNKHFGVGITILRARDMIREEMVKHER